MSKYKVYYDDLDCQIDIPINDMDAWKMYPNYRWIYNKLELALFQEVICGPMPIEPHDEYYPLILKPIMNLYGMGLHSYRLDDIEDFHDQWYHNGFWMELFEGEHLSWDFIILNGKTQYTICFRGKPIQEDLGKFDYWELVLDDLKIPTIINRLIDIHFKNYTGCINIETIGNKIIEVHLRIGDIFLIQDMNFHKGVIENYKGNKYDWSDIKLEPIFFFPLWASDDIPDDMFLIVKDVIGPIIEDLEQDGVIHDYEFDDPSLANPKGWKRLLWFSCSDKEKGLNIRQSMCDILS